MNYLSAVLVAALVFLSQAGYGEKGSRPGLNVSGIPDELKKGADAVLRYSETTQEILSGKKVVFHEHYAVTVLNKRGERFAYFIELYDKSSRIPHISGSVYDTSGNRIEKNISVYVNDYSAVTSGTLYQDDRVKFYKPDVKTYPYTVVYEFDKVYDGMVSYPEWYPQKDYRLGVERATLKIIAEAANRPRYKCRNTAGPRVEEEGGKAIFTWEVSGLIPLKEEPFSGPVTDRVPVVYLAPGPFTYAKTKGDLSTWAGLGRWISGLNKGRQDLPPETVETIRDLVSGLATKREKTKAVYQYMQKHTRYVSVQLGIGGFQPYPASFVDEKGYGDCKALSNYTLALLKAAGVEACYTLVRAGADAAAILRDFPSNQFNHVILCVPDRQDSIWLECTSQEQPFDFLGSFTDDREALLVTGDSGVLVHTPEYSMDQNVLLRRAEVTLDDAGDATAEIFTRYGGLQIENVQDALLLKGEDLKKFYYEELGISDLVIDKIRLEEIADGDLPEIHENLEVGLKKYMSKGGKRVFLPLNLTNRSTKIPKQLDERKSEMVLNYSYMDVDTIVYYLPESLEVEYKPAGVHLETDFGTYQSQVLVDGKQITYIRKITMKKGRYPSEMFEEFALLRKKIVKADKCKVLLKPTQLASKSSAGSQL